MTDKIIQFYTVVSKTSLYWKLDWIILNEQSFLSKKNFMKNINWFLWENVGCFYYCKKSQSVSNGQNVMKTLILSQNISPQSSGRNSHSLSGDWRTFLMRRKRQMGNMMALICTLFCFPFVAMGERREERSHNRYCMRYKAGLGSNILSVSVSQYKRGWHIESWCDERGELSQ